MYNPGKKVATLLVIKSSGEATADKFIEKILNILLKGLMKGEEEMKRYIPNLKAKIVAN